MMPEMRGDELCQKVKNDIDTSHIPVILLTALNTDKNIIDGLQTGADEYVVKPFNIGILRATIANLLANRALLRHRYGNLELNDDTHNTECINCSTDLDWKFIASIKKNVEDNMDNPSFTIDVLCTLLNMSRTVLQQVKGTDRPGAGRLCTVDTPETCHATAEGTKVHHHRSCRNDRFQRCQILP